MIDMQQQKYENVLVPVDGSKTTDKVLNRAIEVAKDNDAHLDILNILEVNQFNQTYGSAVSGDVVFKLTENTDEQLKKYQKQAEDAGVKSVDIHIRFGNPKPIIAREFPKDHNNDVIVIGSTGLSAVERLIIGSVTSYVTRTAKCDVLIVRPKDKTKQSN
ncbi:putative universal stress protein [Lentilactobacillus parabuchneri]|uniref:Universal stress protein n=4 Tax=Lentilactobacillus TaxID=2767893 RepID=A0A0R1YU38_9LACO|nr:UspA domain-containing protein [Lentilactobacillus parabuchneri DSM 5707 = NBRC 107865]KRN80613.1 UspA domain-containing protein [Lentilactobacillus parabuchneri]ORN15035.1 putative universal stress protein [Lentilactobacillus parabuchneri]ORN16885.1 putative universal stress protein [Lentilactobacillus parabuchneri]ORN19925.1 putative universal stress protein [Lentilactobacillus parabuchneri]